MKFITLIAALIFTVNTTSAEVKKISNFQDKDAYPVLIPEVQKITPLKNSFRLPDLFTLAALEGSKIETEIIIKALTKRFPQIKVTPANAQNAVCRLHIDSKNVPESEEGYILKIDQSGIDISARSATGIFYGVQTLANIIRNADSRTLKGCKINDYPDLKMRGVFFNLRGLKSGMVGMFKQTIDALATLKYNYLILEFADNFPLKDNPFTKRTYTLSKKDVSSIVEYARERHFKIIPQVQLLSHTDWLHKHPDFIKKFREGKPVRTWMASYCPSNPEVIKLMFKVLTESVAFFKPQYYMICLDELDGCPWRHCPKCKKRDSSELFTEHAKLMEKKLFDLGCTPMVFQDTFRKGMIGEKTLKQLDRRDVIAIWKYEDQPDEKEFNYFTHDGFPLVGVTYCRSIPNNFNMPKLVLKYNKGLGCYLTYWSYAQRYLHAPEKTHKNAYAGTIVAANYFWKVNGTPLGELSYDSTYQMRRILDPKTPERRISDKAVSVPITGEFNAKLGANPDFPIFSSDKNLYRIKAALAALPEKFDFITTPGGKYYGIMLANNKTAGEPKKIDVPLNVKTDKLSLLMTTSRSSYVPFLSVNYKNVRDKVHIGDLKLNFADGSSENIPLIYRLNIQHWNSDTGVYGARLAMVGSDDKRSVCSFSILDIDIPKGGKTVKSLTLSSERKYDIAPVLLAVSAFDTNSTFKAADTKKLSAIPEHKIQGEDKIFADFESGMGTAKFATQYKYASKPQVSIVLDKTAPVPGKVLKIQVPSPEISRDSRMTHRHGRVIVDVAIPAGSADKTLRFDYRTDVPEGIKKSGTYVSNTEVSKYRKMFNFHSPKSKDWNTIYIPVKRMVREKGVDDCKQDEITKLRISFWTIKPMNIWIDNVGVSQNPDLQLPFKKAKQ